MYVNDDDDLEEAIKLNNRRVVFMEKCGKYVAWNNAKTIEDADKSISTTSWKYAWPILAEKPEADLKAENEYLKKEVSRLAGEITKLGSENAKLRQAILQIKNLDI